MGCLDESYKVCAFALHMEEQGYFRFCRAHFDQERKGLSSRVGFSSVQEKKPAVL